MGNWNNNPLIKQFEQWQKQSPYNTMSGFARHCDISKSMMSRYLSNKSLVSAESLAKICKVLKCKVSDVIEKEE